MGQKLREEGWAGDGGMGGNWESGIVKEACKCNLHCLDWTGFISE